MSRGTDIHSMNEGELRVYAHELAHENRRLRAILEAIAQAGLGTGALFEVFEDNDPDAPFFGVVVCRADRDEAAFVADAETAMRMLTSTVAHLAEKVSGRPARVEASERTGVTRDRTTGEDVPGGGA